MSRTKHNIKRAVHLAFEGQVLGAILMNHYCEHAPSKKVKVWYCTFLLFHPELAEYAPCCWSLKFKDYYTYLPKHLPYDRVRELYARLREYIKRAKGE